MGSRRQTLRDLLTTHARRFEKKTFLVSGERKFSFRDVDDRTDRVATGLSRLGLRSGDRIALLFSNRPEFIFFFFGAAKIGMLAVPIDPLASPADILFAIRKAGATALATEGPFIGKCRELMDQDSGIQHWILGDEETEEQVPFQRLEEEPVLGFWPDLDAGDPAAIEFTRGSTGRPKPVMLSHWNLVSNATQAIQPFRVNETDRFLCSLPLISATSQVLLVLTPWLAGAACILSEYSSPPAVLKALDESHITVLASLPEVIASLAGLRNFGRGGESSLRLAICNSGMVVEETRRRFESSCDAFIVEGYGLVEATCLTCANPYTGVRKPGSVGLPLPGQECRIVDGAGRDAKPGEEGQILVRGSNIMKGYYNDPVLTASVLKDGWLHTGDLARVDADGYYYITGRFRMTNDE